VPLNTNRKVKINGTARLAAAVEQEYKSQFRLAAQGAGIDAAVACRVGKGGDDD
jgi:hypothetical protein